ncbi:uncharacterized protein LOC583181 isoform X1 [Strongylocentrotus purpuratus]|uniref:Uncharacterized protein n=1 Tax=Strongylocentrotus purpuratus TaxID=7668 RepID=A0A7M7PUH3_STRPU|nr:uncharacterized protein LOC583181 isoform X1 [Strongylocentrotus purpuratus]
MADEKSLVSVVEHHTQLLEGVLEGVKLKFKLKDAMQDVIETGISQLGQSIGIYYSLFTSLNIVSRSDLEGLFKRHYHHQTVQDAVSGLEDLETEWDHFLENAQKQMSVVPEGIHNPLKLIVGSQGPCDLTVKNARTGVMSTLLSYLDGTHSLLLVLLRHFA